MSYWRAASDSCWPAAGGELNPRDVVLLHGPSQAHSALPAPAFCAAACRVRPENVALCLLPPSKAPDKAIRAFCEQVARWGRAGLPSEAHKYQTRLPRSSGARLASCSKVAHALPSPFAPRPRMQKKTDILVVGSQGHGKRQVPLGS